MELKLKMNSTKLVANSYEPGELIINVENNARGIKWYEGIILVNGEASLMPNPPLKKAKIRIGIMKKGEGIEKYLHIYPTRIKGEGILARIDVIIFAYDKSGVIIEREEKSVNVSFAPKDSIKMKGEHARKA